MFRPCVPVRTTRWGDRDRRYVPDPPVAKHLANCKVLHAMSKALLLSLIGTALSCALSTPSAAFARDWNAADMLYSRGVQAYFAGQDDEAEQYLTRAVQSNPNDPRPYYFRAMSRLRRGRDAEARQDMQAGAVVEARAPSRWAVGSALERVQGRDRLLLEDYRRRARVD
jgi:Tfp pilus assembly protein PilF